MDDGGGAETAEIVAELGASRVGVSRDDVETQARFRAEHGLDFPLIADEDGQVSRIFGAKRPGPLWSKRRTVVVDRDATVLARVPHSSGLLDGTVKRETEFEPGDHRNWRVTTNERRRHRPHRATRTREC